MPPVGLLVSCPPYEAAMPPVGLLVSCPPCEAAMPPVGLLVSCTPCEAAMPLVATVLMHITIAALPLARLYRFSISLQRCHLSDFIALVSVYSRATFQTLLQFSVYSRATCQTLVDWFQFTDFIALFQFTAVPLVRLYCTDFSLQPCHWSDFIALVSVYSRAIGQTLFH